MIAKKIVIFTTRRPFESKKGENCLAISMLEFLENSWTAYEQVFGITDLEDAGLDLSEPITLEENKNDYYELQVDEVRKGFKTYVKLVKIEKIGRFEISLTKGKK